MKNAHRLTQEQLLALTYDELIKHDVATIQDSMWPLEDRTALPQTHDHIESLLASRRAPYVDEIEKAYAVGNTDITDTITRLGRESPHVVVSVWHELTRHGVQRIEFVKYCHKHMARTIWRIFVPVDEEKEA